MIGLTNLTTNGRMLVEPKLNRRRALFVLDKVDEILSWERNAEQEKDTRFVELGRYLCEVRAGQYWRLENLTFFRRFLDETLSGVQAQSLLPDGDPRAAASAAFTMTCRQVGWAKAAELAKVARRDGEAV